MSFLNRIETFCESTSASQEQPNTIQPGSSHPENWATSLHSGKSQEELRQDAIALHDWITGIQETFSIYKERYDHLTKGEGKHFELYSPILSKGLSRSKLTALAEICNKLASMAPIE